MSDRSRRDFIKHTAAAAAAIAAAMPLAGCGSPDEEPDPEDSPPPGSDPPTLEVAMLIYPGMTALDMVAPQICFNTLGNVHLHHVWKDLSPIACDSGLTILPNATLDDCPEQLDILFVGGASFATWALMSDETILRFLESRGATAALVTSVCTGSMLLAAAGLLTGYRATGNWATRHLLDQLGATCVHERVVTDRNRITGAGVTAGMDFGLRVSEALRGREFAEVQQLMMEYAPEPPFSSGSPDQAPPTVLAAATDLYAPSVVAAEEATTRAAERLNL
jgi:cyclohexyl-isocyanide hydratase